MVSKKDKLLSKILYTLGILIFLLVIWLYSFPNPIQYYSGPLLIFVNIITILLFYKGYKLHPAETEKGKIRTGTLVILVFGFGLLFGALFLLFIAVPILLSSNPSYRFLGGALLIPVIIILIPAVLAFILAPYKHHKFMSKLKEKKE